MKLREYLDLVGIPMAVFARRIGISPRTIGNLVEQKRDILLSNALKIEEATNGQVTCYDLLETEYCLRKRRRFKKKAQNANSQEDE